MDRIIGAFTFRSGVYADVEQDSSFTSTAWLIVAVVSLLNQLGSRTFDTFGNWLLGAIVGTIFAVLGFALATYIINLVGRVVFKADVNFNELLRTVGLAYVWQVVGFLGIVGAFSVALQCIVSPALVIGVILWLVASFIAAKEALDLEWLQTIITVFLGWLAYMVVLALTGIVLAAIGIGGAALFGSLF
jgi:hypothetical protein